MKKLICIVCAIAVLLVCAAGVAEDKQTETAEAVMRMLSEGQTEAVWNAMTPEAQQAISAQQIEAAILQLGAITAYECDGVTQQGGLSCFSFHVTQNGEYAYLIALDPDGAVAGLNIRPYTPPPETDATVYTEEVLLRASEADETPATLTLPDGSGPFPAVILVQGSGPSDQNESAYGISPFLDLAEGLAKNGIASIRYDKYTFAHAALAAANPRFTVEEEYITDARAALDALENDPRIRKIFLIGHSQGGMLMPRIIAELGAERFAGGISLAGTPLHFWEVQYRQNLDVLETLAEDVRPAAQAMIDAEYEKAARLAELDESELPEDTVFGLPAYYQWDEARVDAAECVEANGVPVLALQGDADFQVPVSSGTELWAARCDGVECVTLPGITHLLTFVEEPALAAADYVAGSHVDTSVTETLAGWILGIAS